MCAIIISENDRFFVYRFQTVRPSYTQTIPTADSAIRRRSVVTIFTPFLSDSSSNGSRNVGPAYNLEMSVIATRADLSAPPAESNHGNDYVFPLDRRFSSRNVANIFRLLRKPYSSAFRVIGDRGENSPNPVACLVPTTACKLFSYKNESTATKRGLRFIA